MKIPQHATPEPSVGTAGCSGGSDGAGPVVHCRCDGLQKPPAMCHYTGFPIPEDPHPDLPCPPCGTNNCSCPIPPPLPTPPPPPPPTPPGQCVVQKDVSFNGGNLFGNKTCPVPDCNKFVNYTNSQDDCCQMCHETTGCIFWTFRASGCTGSKGIGCCYLKSEQAWFGRSSYVGSTSGSTHLFPPPPVVPPPAPPAPDPSTTYNFLGLADWGSSTATAINPWQKAVADGMGTVAQEINAAAVFCLGDNFYGASAADPPSEARIKGTFEDVYNATSLKSIPFWAIAGNHDWGGNVSEQIAYHNSPQNGPPLKDGLGGRWRYPDFWYNVTQTIVIPKSGGKTVNLEVLLFDPQVDQLKPSRIPTRSDEMYDWLEKRIAASTADYLWVGSHYPVYSIGGHGPDGSLIMQVKPLLEKYEANYFNGHDHDLIHMRLNGSKVNYVTTGSGMQCCYPDAHLTDPLIPAGSVRFAMVDGPGDGPTGSGFEPMPFAMVGGFTSYRIGVESMEVVFHAHNGTVLYTTPKIMPRNLTEVRLNSQK